VAPYRELVVGDEIAFRTSSGYTSTVDGIKPCTDEGCSDKVVEFKDPITGDPISIHASELVLVN
jgi:hypothetical protein